MASLRECARRMLDTGRDGIGWIALWKEGRSWDAEDFYPDVDYDLGEADLYPWDVTRLKEIIDIDPDAIFVNSWYHNLGDTEAMDAASLDAALRWQYVCCHPRLSNWRLNAKE